MTADEQKRIDDIERERRRREAALLALLLLFVSGSAVIDGAPRRNRRNALRFAMDAISMGHDPAHAVYRVLFGDPQLHLPGLPNVITQAAIEAWTTGYKRAFLLAGLPKPQEHPIGPKPPPPTQPPPPHQMPPPPVGRFRQEAVSLTQRIQTALERIIRDTVAKGVRLGRTTSQIMTDVAEAFTRWGYTATPPQTVEPESTGSPAWALAKLATDEILSAWGDGYGDGTFAGPTLSKATALRHHSILDDRTSEYCDEFSGRPDLTLPPAHPYWSGNWPPLHAMCRSLVMPVFDEDVEFSERLPILPAAPGWGQML